MVFYLQLKLITFYMVFYLLLKLITFYIVFYQLFRVNCISGGVLSNLTIIAFHLCLHLARPEC